MYHGDGQRAYARLVFHIQNGAVNIHAVGVRAVKHNHLLAKLGATIHEALHGDIVGVETQTYVLNIAQQHVKLLHLGIIGGAALHAIQRVDGYTCLLVNRAAHLFACVGLTTKAMFGREDGYHVYLVFKQHVEQVLVAHHACLV